MRYVGRGQMHQRNEAPARNRNAEQAASQRKQKPFDKKLAHEPATGRANRSTDRQLSLAGGGLGEQEVRHIGAGNHEKEEHRTQQNKQGRTHVGAGCSLKGDNRDFGDVSVLPILLLDLPRDSSQFGMSLWERDAVAQASDTMPVMRSAAG